jgi:transketolase
MAALGRVTGDAKHLPAANSTLDVLWVLYDRILRVDPARPDDPDRNLIPGVEISSGSLGHGPPLAVGAALGLRAQGLTSSQVYVLVGDAELDEGSNHEAIAYAGTAGLDHLTAIVVDNRSSTHGWPGGIASRFAVNGWTTATVDGRDHDDLATALRNRPSPQPHVVVARVEPKFL